MTILNLFTSRRRYLQGMLPQSIFAGILTLLAILFIWYAKKRYRSIESDQRPFKALFDHATEGIILTDEKGKIILVNPAGFGLFQYQPNELPGQPVDLLIPQRFHHSHEKQRQGFYQHPGNRTMGHGRELFARKKDGTEFPVEVSLSYYSQNNALFVIAFVVDITSRKQNEQELIDRQQQLETITGDVRRLNSELEAKVEQRTSILREALQELEQSQEELGKALSKEKELGEIKSRFVSMASHEFRTPLSTILSSANLLSRYTTTEDQDKRDKHIGRTKDAVKHLNELLGDFLSLGKLAEGKVRSEPTPLPLREFLQDLTEEMQSLAKEGQVIHCTYSGDDIIHSDRHLLKNILINLLSNAIKFSGEATSIHLEVGLLRDGGIAISVRDQGIGISNEDKPQLFSSFFRGANVVNIEGTGLGLTIVRSYLDLLQGKIRLDSGLGSGTLVTIELPGNPS
jgi:PAS domain S-box-containing protein